MCCLLAESNTTNYFSSWVLFLLILLVHMFHPTPLRGLSSIFYTCFHLREWNSPTKRVGTTEFQVKSYYGVLKNLPVKFKDDTIYETSTLAQVLIDSVISSMLDMSIRSLPGNHGLPWAHETSTIAGTKVFAYFILFCPFLLIGDNAMFICLKFYLPFLKRNM